MVILFPLVVMELAVAIALTASDWCYTSGINTHEGTGKAMAEALLRLLPHNGTQLYGITIEYVVSCTCFHPVHKCDEKFYELELSWHTPLQHLTHR